ncbi:2Fe-2S iron-sulfur cluster-binding protein [Euzebya tangerina]|uniref:2Fe-2S iron-sulfur cluster-binding protein n=1 Tax=Euzebya tangerina TaxID=591198 RepID=UPI00196BA2A4|nr:2Fe-2S iron-sulfur cluster-binding protein [Euzebya tangerina]
MSTHPVIPRRPPAPPEPPPVSLTIDGQQVDVPAGTTLLDACHRQQIDTPTLCYSDVLEPAAACRVCVVEVEGSRTLVPSCARKVEDGMVVQTNSERVRHSRRMVLELLGSSVDMSYASSEIIDWTQRYEADPDRYGEAARTVEQPAKIDNALYMRDYSRCITCYKCVDACGEQAQNTFAITVAGRGFEAGVSTEYDVALGDSACVFCGNCIAVCPTGAIMFSSEHQLREEGLWDEDVQEVTRTVCSFCGVGCNLELHVQDNRIVKVTSPQDHEVTSGHLCIKGRFGYDYVQNLPDPMTTPIDDVLAAARASGRDGGPTR